MVITTKRTIFFLKKISIHLFITAGNYDTVNVWGNSSPMEITNGI